MSEPGRFFRMRGSLASSANGDKKRIDGLQRSPGDFGTLHR
jgi:hypothetical protein